jgi:hypothetical protein
MLSYATRVLTVPEAARRAGCDRAPGAVWPTYELAQGLAAFDRDLGSRMQDVVAETVRRWIRSGRLRSRRIGTQHLIDESHLRALVPVSAPSLSSSERRNSATGEPMPDVIRAVRRSREGH